jgi:hypothetical protein
VIEEELLNERRITAQRGHVACEQVGVHWQGSALAPDERLRNTLILAHVLSLLFIGKNVDWALSQVFSNELKKYRRCIKRCKKSDCQ